MEVCRLCLELQTDNSFSLLDGNFKDMVQVVAPELNVDISKAPVVCNQCSSNLKQLFVFKTRCFENEEQIRSKCEKNKNKLRLKEVIFGTAIGEVTPLKTEKAKERLCRTCTGDIECESFTFLKPSEPDAYLDGLLTMCLPEVDLELTKEPVICEVCLENLQKLHHFKSACLDIEDKLTTFCETHGTNSKDQINLNSVLEFNTPMDSEFVHIKPEEFNDESKDASIKSENESEITVESELKQEEIEIKSEAGTSAGGNDNLHDNTRRKLPNSTFERTVQEKIKTFKCPECSYLTPRKVNLTDHLLRKHGKGDQKKFKQCNLCEFRAVRQCDLKIHVRNIHKKIPRYECGDCCFKTFYIATFREHLLKQHEKCDGNTIQCTECSYKTTHKRNMTEHLLKIHGRSREGMVKYCPHCEFHTTIPGSLKKHLKSIHGKCCTMLQCADCTFKTWYKPNLSDHLLKIHGKFYDNRFKACPQCPFTTTQSANLNRHVKSVHEKCDESMLKCSDCIFKTSYKKSLTEHLLRFHGKYNNTGVLKYCTSCNFKTTVGTNLKRHLKKVHKGQ